MGFEIDTLRAKLENLARPNLFSVEITKPKCITSTDWDGDLIKFTCKSSKMPGRSVGKIEVPFAGRKIFFPGDVTFQDWDVTIVLNRNLNVWERLYEWQEAWNSATGNLSDSESSVHSQYKTNAVVKLYSNTQAKQKQFTITGIFPIDIPPIELGWDNTDSTLDVQCTFGLDYFKFS